MAGRFLERVFKNHISEGARFFIRNIFGEKRGLRTFHEQELIPKKQTMEDYFLF